MNQKLKDLSENNQHSLKINEHLRPNLSKVLNSPRPWQKFVLGLLMETPDDRSIY